MVKKRYPQTILATACIPWTPDFMFDETLFRHEIRTLLRHNIKYIYLFGTAGEGYGLTDEQFESIVRVFAEEMSGSELYPIVGLVSLSLNQMVQRLNQSYSFGIRNFLVALPAWGALHGDELFDFWHILCDPFPDCLFLHYNNMRSKRIISISEYEKLADEIPNLAGAKYSTTDLASILDLAVSDCPLRFFLTERGYAYGSLVGDFGFLLSIATTNVNRACQFFLAGVNKEYSMLIDMQKELHSMQKHLIMIAGDDKIDGAYDKMFCKRLNSSFPLRLLPPYRGVTDEAYASYINFLENHYPQWLSFLS